MKLFASIICSSVLLASAAHAQYIPEIPGNPMNFPEAPYKNTAAQQQYLQNLQNVQNYNRQMQAQQEYQQRMNEEQQRMLNIQQAQRQQQIQPTPQYAHPTHCTVYGVCF